MKKISFALLSVSYLLLANTSHATSSVDTSLDEYVYDLYTGGNFNIDYTMNADASNIIIDGTSISVGVSGWSDTLSVGNSGNDNEVEYYSSLNAYSSNGDVGFGLVNSQHNDGHTLDNFTGGDDFDMVLFSFSEEVSLSGASFTWLQGYDTGKQITVVGLNDISLFENHSSNEFTWADVASSAATVITSGHFNISSNISSGGQHGNFTSDFGDLSVAKYWLVGSYNTYFDDNSSSHQGSGFKLASLGFETADPSVEPGPPTEVSEPASVALMLTGFGLLAWRRKRTSRY